MIQGGSRRMLFQFVVLICIVLAVAAYASVITSNDGTIAVFGPSFSTQAFLVGEVLQGAGIPLTSTNVSSVLAKKVLL